MLKRLRTLLRARVYEEALSDLEALTHRIKLDKTDWLILHPDALKALRMRQQRIQEWYEPDGKED